MQGPTFCWNSSDYYCTFDAGFGHLTSCPDLCWPLMHPPSVLLFLLLLSFLKTWNSWWARRVMSLLQVSWRSAYGGALKGTVPRDSEFRFYHESVSPKPLSIPLGHFRYFFQKFSEIFVAQGAPPVSWHRWHMEKIFNQKSFNYFFRHLWVLELT